MKADAMNEIEIQQAAKEIIAETKTEHWIQVLGNADWKNIQQVMNDYCWYHRDESFSPNDELAIIAEIKNQLQQ